MEVPIARVIEEFQKRYRGENWNGFISEEPPLMETRKLETLRSGGRVLGVVTGRPEAEARQTLERLGWKKYFPLLVAREKQEGRGKPDPFPLQHALGVLEVAGLTVSPRATAYIGDSVDDMRAARRADMWAIGVVPPYLPAEAHAGVLQEAGAHIVIHDPNTLPDLVDEFGPRVALEMDEEEEA